MTMNFRSAISRHTPRMVLLGAMTLLLAACASYPLGMSKEEWARLTPEQQMEARMKQADLNRANAERRAAQAEARRQRYAAAEAAERRRLEEIYAASRYGDVLECVVEGGSADFHGWRTYTPVPFTLARGEVKSVSLSGGNRKSSFWAQYSPDGLSMKICYGDPRKRGGRFCAAINGQTADFSAGITRRVSVSRIFRDANVVCAHRPERDMPQIYVRRHNAKVYRVIHHHHYKSRVRRTPAVFYRDYDGPAPRHRTKTVIHKHYNQAPPPQRVRRPDYNDPRKNYDRDRRQTYERDRRDPRPEYRPRQAPDNVEARDVDTGRRASPGPRVPDHARSHDVANPRSAVQSGNTASVKTTKKSDKKGKRKKDKVEYTDEEYLTSAPGPGKKRGYGKYDKNEYGDDEDYTSQPGKNRGF